MPTRRWRVVCGLSETIASFSPSTRLSSVDLPALGRPTSATAPALAAGPSTSWAAGASGTARLLLLVGHRLRLAPPRSPAVVRLGPDPQHPAAVGGLDREAQAQGIHNLTAARDGAQGGGDQPADRLERRLADFDAEDLLELAQPRRPGQPPGAAAQLLVVARRLVGLVGDLAHDPLQEILHGHHAGGAAVLVHHDRQLQPAGLELAQQLVERLG